MICFRCKKRVDPILTYARPHGRYSKCEDCRRVAAEKRLKKRKVALEVLGLWIVSRNCSSRQLPLLSSKP